MGKSKQVPKEKEFTVLLLITYSSRGLISREAEGCKLYWNTNPFYALIASYLKRLSNPYIFSFQNLIPKPLTLNEH